MTVQHGTAIRYTEGNLGMVGTPDLIDAGDTGTVIGPMEDAADWYLTAPDRYPGRACPVHVSMFEPVA